MARKALKCASRTRMGKYYFTVTGETYHLPAWAQIAGRLFSMCGQSVAAGTSTPGTETAVAASFAAQTILVCVSVDGKGLQLRRILIPSSHQASAAWEPYGRSWWSDVYRGTIAFWSVMTWEAGQGLCLHDKETLLVEICFDMHTALPGIL